MGLAFKVLGIVGLSSYAVAYACAKLRHVSYYRYKLIVVPADALPDMPAGYSARMLSPDALAGFTIDVGAAAQRERFAGGLECLGIFDRKGALVGVTWLARNAHHEPGINVRYLLPENAAWDTGLWVPEEKRMGRAFAAVWGGIKAWLHREGLDCTLSSIADYNIASILSHRRLGSRRLGYVTIIRIGRLQITRGARPFLSLAGRRAVPTVKFSLA